MKRWRIIATVIIALAVLTIFLLPPRSIEIRYSELASQYDPKISLLDRLDGDIARRRDAEAALPSIRLKYLYRPFWVSPPKPYYYSYTIHEIGRASCRERV